MDDKRLQPGALARSHGEPARQLVQGKIRQDAVGVSSERAVWTSINDIVLAAAGVECTEDES